MTNVLQRDTTNGVLFGVCAGLANYFSVDVTLVRLAFVVGLFFTLGLDVIVYLALCFLEKRPEE
jgi:phage shock protein PspC (stress-responsive transcriptional regulator)